MSVHKQRRAGRNKQKGKGATQFSRTTKKTGKWRGKPAREYKPYKAKKKIAVPEVKLDYDFYNKK